MRIITLLTVMLLIVPMTTAISVSSADTNQQPSEGTPSLGIDFSIGELMTTLLCSCVEDDSCSDDLSFVCSGFIDIPGADDTFLRPLVDATADPAQAMCAVGMYAFAPDSIPPGVNAFESVGSATPDVPLVMIEAVRIAGDDYTYAIRYTAQISDEEFDDYDGIDYTLTRGSSSHDVFDSALPPDDMSDLPISVTFETDDLYTHACMSFDEVPEGLPGEFCVPIREVDA